jgi:hemerythrin
MTTRAWSDDLGVGVEAVDAEHRELIEHLEGLRRAHAAGQGGLLAGLDALIDATHRHFKNEEAAMARSSYPQLEAHVRDHIELSSRVLQIRQRLAAGDVSTLGFELLGFLEGWLLDHIRTADRAFGAFIVGGVEAGDE